MAGEKNYDFFSQASSIDDKIKNSLSSTSLAFQQTFLSKSMPDLGEITIGKNGKSFSEDPYGENRNYSGFPEIPQSTSNGVLDAQSDMRLRRKSVGDMEEIKFFNSEAGGVGDPMYGHEAQFQPEIHEGVDRLLIKKRSILNEFNIPNVSKDAASRRDIKSYYQEPDDVSNYRDSNLKELTSLMVKKSPRKLTIAEEYQKFQLESKMQNDIKRAQSIVNSTLEEKINACQTNRDGFDSLDSSRRDKIAQQQHQQEAQLKRLGPADVDALINNRRPLEEIKNELSPQSPLVGFSESYEPEDEIPKYSNRDEKNKNEKIPSAPIETEEEQPSGEKKSYYPIKMYVKQPKQKVKGTKKSNAENNNNSVVKGNSTKTGSYADMANKKSAGSISKNKQNNNNKFGKKQKRKVQSAGPTDKPKNNKNNNKQKVGDTRGEVKSALEETGPFCKCSDEEEEQDAPADAKHTLDYPIVRPVFNGNYVLENDNVGNDQPYYLPPQAMPGGGFYIPPQAALQQNPDIAPFRGSVNGNIYFNGGNDGQQYQPQYQHQQNGGFMMQQQQQQQNYNFQQQQQQDPNQGRYGDCPMAQNYFNRFSQPKTFHSEYLQEMKSQPRPPAMPKLPVGLHNPSLEMMHTPVESGIYTTTGQEFLPPVSNYQAPQEMTAGNQNYNGISSPQNTSSGYSTDEGNNPVVDQRPPVIKQKQRISKSFSQNSAEELQDEIIRVS